MRLIWNLLLSVLVIGAALCLLLRWLGRCGAPIRLRTTERTAPTNGAEISNLESAQIFGAALLFRAFVFAAAAVLAVTLLGKQDVLAIWRQWDAFHYVNLVELGYAGYTENGQNLFVVFFPLYVWIVRLVRLLAGSTLLAGILTSSLCYAGGCVFFYKLAAYEFGRGVARRAVLFLSVFPYAFFFGGMMTEGLFLLTTAGGLYAISRHRWLAAGIWGALAAMTRMHGVLLVGAALVELLETERPFAQRGAVRRRSLCAILKRLPLLLMPLLGTLVYLGLNFHVLGDPFGFTKMQQHWSQGFHWVSDTLWYVLNNALFYPDRATRMQLWIPEILLFFLFFSVLIAARKHHRSMLVLYGFVYLILNYSLSWLLSAGRYLSCALPFFLFAAVLTEKRPKLAQAVAVVMGLFFVGNLTTYLVGGQIM